MCEKMKGKANRRERAASCFFDGALWELLPSFASFGAWKAALTSLSTLLPHSSTSFSGSQKRTLEPGAEPWGSKSSVWVLVLTLWTRVPRCPGQVGGESPKASTYDLRAHEPNCRIFTSLQALTLRFRNSQQSNFTRPPVQEGQ